MIQMVVASRRGGMTRARGWREVFGVGLRGRHLLIGQVGREGKLYVLVMVSGRLSSWEGMKIAVWMSGSR